MTAVFCDAGYWIALLNQRDELHESASAASKSLGRVHYVTTEMVLTEVLNGLAGRGSRLRALAVQLTRKLQACDDVTVVPQTPQQFDSALSFYEKRKDKKWGHTDCASFGVMQERNIMDALAHDRHFEEAGFRALLRGPG